MSTPQPAEVLFLPELHQSYQLYGISSIMNKFIRITGRIVHIDYSQRFCIIEDDKYHLKLMIEISLLDFNLLKLAEIHQFIGTIDAMENPPMAKYENCDDFFFLKAKIIRNIDGLDLGLYEKAILKRREFIQNTLN